MMGGYYDGANGLELTAPNTSIALPPDSGPSTNCGPKSTRIRVGNLTSELQDLLPSVHSFTSLFRPPSPACSQSNTSFRDRQKY
ncbi:uncharacterized protein ARMOST_19126 [Armillaria ostoyae]|uniref:Uncharacterized protein n=1 Tax=Armillaria ostoyae TaxID=47428 RepID=A0A284S3N7_ARMOS|nr:uncharacterized protein ARMOST_19126 [Armillaria ostoyae]